MTEALWFSGVACRVADASLERLDDADVGDAPWWDALAGVSLSMIGGLSPIGRFLGAETALREPTLDELDVYDHLRSKHERRHDLDGIMHAIVRATDQRGDYAGGALLREALRLVQAWKR